MARRQIAMATCGATLLGGGTAPAATAPYQEQFRPQFHFSPPQHWMNDPNGLVYLHGQYHLFYQYHPFGMTWGPMHWGHAVSADMVHWSNLPIALYPNEHGTIFSGSAVVDRRNSSGLGSLQSPPLVAIFTNHDASAEKAGRKDFQNQSLAYSLDAGRSWTQYPGNPVLRNPGHKDFRDPKVSWFEPAAKWIMTLAVGDHVEFYSSPDLLHWTHESDFGTGSGAHQGVWECPDLVSMSITGEKFRKYVLLVSVNPGAPNGGSGTQFFVGDFDGHEFKQSQTGPAGQAEWVDYGPDDYAGVTWSGVPAEDGRTLFLGWMSNWQYAQKVPTSPWRSAMTLPRELKLLHAGQGWELHSQPVRELESLRAETRRVGGDGAAAAQALSRGVNLQRDSAEIELNIDLGQSESAALQFANQRGEKTVFRVNRALQRYELDRSGSGDVSFDPRFPTTATAPMRTFTGKISVHAFLDRSSLELFINDGETVMTSLHFPSTPYNNVRLVADKPAQVTAATIYTLKSIWTQQ
jgi:fructan beta-fructosidase